MASGGGGDGSGGNRREDASMTALRLAARAFYLSPIDASRAKRARARGSAGKAGALSVDPGVELLEAAGPAGEHEAVLPSSSKALILAKSGPKSLVAAGSAGALSVLGTGKVHPAGKRAQNEAEARAQLGKACVVVIDALCRAQGWVKEESLAKDLRLSQRLVKRALRVLSLDHLIRREMVRAKALTDGDVKRTLQKEAEAGNAAENSAQLLYNKKREESAWCRVDLPRAMEALKLKLKRMRDTVLHQLNDENLGRTLRCLNCGEQYTSLEAMNLSLKQPPFLLDPDDESCQSGVLYYPVRNHLEWPQIAGRLVVEGGRRKRVPLSVNVDVFKRLDTMRKNRKMAEAMDTVCLKLGKKPTQPLEREDLMAMLTELLGDDGLSDSDISYFRAMINTDVASKPIARHIFAERVLEAVQLQKFVCTPHCAKLRDVRVRARTIDQSKLAKHALLRITACFEQVVTEDTGGITYDQARQMLVNLMPKVPGDEQRAFLVLLRQTNTSIDGLVRLKDVLLALELQIVDIVGGRHIVRPPRSEYLEGLDEWKLFYVEDVNDSENLYCTQCRGVVDYIDEQHDVRALTGDISGESSEERRSRYQDILARLSVQLKPLFAQLESLTNTFIPDYGTLQEWREFKIRDAELKRREAEERQRNEANGIFDVTPQRMLFEPDSGDGVAIIIDDDDNNNRDGNVKMDDMGNGAAHTGTNGANGNHRTNDINDGHAPFHREVAPWEADAQATTFAPIVKEDEGGYQDATVLHPSKKSRHDTSDGFNEHDTKADDATTDKQRDDTGADDDIDWEED